MKSNMTRRTFVRGAASVPMVFVVGQIPTFEAANASAVVEPVAHKPLIMKTINDANMAGFEWRWDFVLQRSSDGTYTVTGTQYDKFAEENEEPWELDPYLSLRDGREICSALCSMVNDNGYYADAEFLEPIADKLESYDPRLAEEFRAEVSDLAEEMGWDQ